MYIVKLEKKVGGCESRFIIKLPEDYNYIIKDRKCIVKKLVDKHGFVIVDYDNTLDNNIKPSIVGKSLILNIPKKIVDEWYDTGEYNVIYDYEFSQITLIKKPLL